LFGITDVSLREVYGRCGLVNSYTVQQCENKQKYDQDKLLELGLR